MVYSRVATVTGGNKGIGLAIVRQLALKYPSSAFNNGKLLVYLTARDKSKGEAALADILADAKLKEAKALTQDGGLMDVKYAELDVDSTDSIRKFAAMLKSEHPEGINFVINNAGIALNGFDQEVVEKTIHTNYYGVLETTQDLLPLIRPGGRLVNLASMVGQVGKYSKPLQQRFLAVSTIAEATSLMEDFKKAVAEDKIEENGWTAAAYAASKAGVIALTHAIAQDEAKTGRGILVNSCCPGWVQTDMTKGKGLKTVDQGAETPVMLALGDIGGQFGKFWQDEKVISKV